MKLNRKTAIFLAVLLCLLLFAGCGNDDKEILLSSCETGANVSLSSASSVSQDVSTHPESLSESSTSASQSGASSALEYSWYTGDPEKTLIYIPVGETLTLSDGRVLESGLLLPDGRFFPSEELKRHNYESGSRSFILPDGTILNPRHQSTGWEGRLTIEEWEKQEAENFPEEERWQIAPWTKEAEAAQLGEHKGTWNGLWKPAEEESSLQSGSEN